MKRFYSILITLFAFTVVSAQENNDYGFKKGDFFISGALKYSALLSDKFSSTD
ncbi:hypothetical protein [Aquimarina sp. RZ0]|uniref:hypothetical protein n=1 Tax=Aquimarina sp. RZ0 TaxID=2607730 RepID=UPI00165FB1D9|nr:hypothetical protein [Aquimarina sp. RZ0]